MFTGIVEARSQVINVFKGEGVLRIKVQKPSHFDDLKIGDSVSVNGICLTVETLEDSLMTFAIANETLQVTGWDEMSLADLPVNLERPLVVNSRLHGHWVTGHVDAVLKVIEEKVIGENKILKVNLPEQYKLYIIEKGSVTLQGVALTINEVEDHFFSVCLIPETLSQTNLNLNYLDKFINVEFDYLVKIINKSLVQMLGSNSESAKVYEKLRGQNA